MALLLSVGIPVTNVSALSLSDPVGSLTNTVGSTLPAISTPVPSLTNTVTSTLTATNENIVLNNVQSKSGMTSLTNHMTLSSFNAGTGTDRLLVVGISANNINAVAVTFGGIPLTRAVSSFSNHDSEFWYLKNPSGTANIVITMTGSTAAVVGAYAFSGVDQADPIPTTATNSATANSNPSISLITKFPNSWMLDLPSIDGGVTLGSPTCTQQWNINMPGTITGASSSRIAAFPAVVTCNWTASGSGAPWNDAAIEVKAAGSSILGLNVGVSPSPPTNLVANTVSISQINLSWTAPSINTGDLIVTGYQIERSTDSGTTWSTIVANTGSTATTYSDTGLDAGTTYMYRVSAINPVGTSSPSNTASTSTGNPTISQPPTGLTAAAVSSSQINLRWNAPSDDGGSAITGYMIERSNDTGTTWSIIVSNTGSTDTTYSDTGLAANTMYMYQVSAINAVGTSSPSNTASANTSTQSTVSQPPTGLTAAAVSSSQINLSWNAPSDDGGSAITGYDIQRSNDSGTTWNTIVSDTGSTDTTYSDTGLAANTMYMYQVSAINAVGTSSPSNTASATTQAASTSGGITVYAHRIPASYWDPCFATQCSAGTGPGASMYVVLYDSSGNVVQTGFSDENGYTFSGLNSSATYYVYPDDCDNCHGAPHDVVFQYWGDDHSSTRPRAATVGTSLDAWYSCTNGCSGGP